MISFKALLKSFESLNSCETEKVEEMFEKLNKAFLKLFFKETICKF